MAAIGKKAGAILVGMGGVGKSSLAGRAMARLKEDDNTRLNGIVALLQTQRVLLVLDNFEDNLELGSKGYLDETTAAWLRLFAERTQTGKLLLRSRYPLPDGGAYFDDQALGP